MINLSCELFQRLPVLQLFLESSGHGSVAVAGPCGHGARPRLLARGRFAAGQVRALVDGHGWVFNQKIFHRSIRAFKFPLSIEARWRLHQPAFLRRGRVAGRDGVVVAVDARLSAAFRRRFWVGVEVVLWLDEYPVVFDYLFVFGHARRGGCVFLCGWFLLTPDVR